MQDDPKCPRCGCTLKIETIRVPTYAQYLVEGHSTPIRGEMKGFETREEVSDCPRCTGSY